MESKHRTPGAKDDDGKVRIELVAPSFIWATASVLTFGAIKYDDHNWAKGIKWSRVFGALMRHLWAWWAGRGPTSRNFLFGELDDETKFPHLWHACCCLMFLVAYEDWGMVGFDDRFTAPEKQDSRGFEHSTDDDDDQTEPAYTPGETLEAMNRGR